MCLAFHDQVRKVSGNTAILSDGQKVRIDGIGDVVPGDYLEVYAGIAITKVAAADAQAVFNLRVKRGSKS